MLVLLLLAGKGLAKQNRDFRLSLYGGYTMEREEDDQVLVMGGRSRYRDGQGLQASLAFKHYPGERTSATPSLLIERERGGMAAGNYHLHLGTGLYVGKRSFYVSSPYDLMPSVSREMKLRPDTSGSGQYSLRGAALYFNAGRNVRIGTWYSNRLRYADLSEKRIETTLYTLNGYPEPAGDRRDTVVRHDQGILLSYTGRHVCLESTFSAMVLENDRRILPWQYREIDGKPWSRNIQAGGSLYGRVAWPGLVLFGEVAHSHIRGEYGKHRQSWQGGNALRTGIAGGSKRIYLALLLHREEPDYLAPLSDGISVRNRWEIRMTLRPWKWYTLTLLAETRKTASSEAGEPESMRASAGMKFRWKRIEAKLAGRVVYGGEDPLSWQIKTGVRGKIGKKWALEGRSRYQRKGSSVGISAETLCTWKPMKVLTLDGRYRFTFVQEGNGVYLGSFSVDPSLFPLVYRNRTGHGISARIVLKQKNLKLAVKGNASFMGEKFSEGRMDFAAGLNFP
jgi:hypothetical protein